MTANAINPELLWLFKRVPPETGQDRLRYRQSGGTRKERVGIIRAAHLYEWAFRCARQLHKALDGNLCHCRLILPEALDGFPGHRESAGILDVNVHLQHLTVLDEVKAFDDVKLFRVRRSESVHMRPVIESAACDDARIAFVMADGFAIPRVLD